MDFIDLRLILRIQEKWKGRWMWKGNVEIIGAANKTWLRPLSYLVRSAPCECGELLRPKYRCWVQHFSLRWWILIRCKIQTIPFNPLPIRLDVWAASRSSRHSLQMAYTEYHSTFTRRLLLKLMINCRESLFFYGTPFNHLFSSFINTDSWHNITRCAWLLHNDRQR